MIDSRDSLLKIKPRRSIRFQVKLTYPELEKLKNKTGERGFTTVSQMLRVLALEHDDVVEIKINETNRIVKEILQYLKERDKQGYLLKAPIN